jgi:AraC-like DNA-binding protein
MKQIKYLKHRPNKEGKEFYVSGVGVREIMRPGIVNRPNGTGDWLLMFFHDPVKIKVSEDIVNFPGNTFMIWTPKDGHLYGNTDKEWMHSWIHCHGSDVPVILRESGFKKGAFSFEDPSILEKQLLSVYSEIIGYKNPDAKILESHFKIMVREMKRSLEKSESKRLIPKNILKAKSRIELNSNRKLRLSELAGISNMSVPHFCSEFKKHTGFSPIDYSIEVKMERAGYLLLDKNLQIGEIAAITGYEDIYQFSKLFKKRFGMSPSKYRKGKI